LGYSKKIIYRNKAKLNDDIYVTGNLGDSYLGFKALSNKVKFRKFTNVGYSHSAKSWLRKSS